MDEFSIQDVGITKIEISFVFIKKFWAKRVYLLYIWCFIIEDRFYSFV